MVFAMDETRELDLYNFDAEENRTSRYVLTSPRSLRACAYLRIKVSKCFNAILYAIEFCLDLPFSITYLMSE